MEKPGREKEVRGKKRDGQQRKEKGKDGNGKNERIYPLENILFDTNMTMKTKDYFIDVPRSTRPCPICGKPVPRLSSVATIIKKAIKPVFPNNTRNAA